ncbi:MAG TPA: hypothetical protein VF212_11930 [Longimicrobiales bacterium]
MKAPPLDPRTRDDIVATAVDDLAPLYTPAWTGAGDPDDPGHRLIELFARLAELLIERLNGMPRHNFLSFLELTGVERFPGAPAEAPVTFVVSKRAPLGGRVPARTQVATTQTEKSDALVFETRRDFFATPAVLERIIAVLPAADRFVELPIPAVPPDADALASAASVAVFDEREPELEDVDHVLYIGSATLFSRPDQADVRVTLHLASGAFPGDVVWRCYDEEAKDWVDLPAPVVVAGADRVTFTFQRLSGVGKTTVDGVEDHWLAAHFTGEFDAAYPAPKISAIEASAAAPSQPLTRFDAAFYNVEPIDLSRPYHPFGRRPAYGDAFYFASDAAFAPDVESVTLSFTIRPHTTADIQAQYDGVPSTTLVTRAVWQFLDADGAWQELAEVVHEFEVTTDPSGTTVTATSTTAPPGENASEGTFLYGSPVASVASVTRSGFQDRIGRREVHGVSGHWMRVLLLSEAPYGSDGVLVDGASPRFIGPLFFPPVIEGVQLSYVPRSAAVPIRHVKTLNAFEFVDHCGTPTPFDPFRDVASRTIAGRSIFGADAALYLGFDRAFDPEPLSLFFDLAAPASSLDSPIEGGDPRLAWEYWSADAGWVALGVVDDTLELTTSGTVAFNGPADAAPVQPFAWLRADGAADPAARRWLRARLAGGRYDHPPAVRGVYLNTVLADNRTTRAEQLVGSSNGEPDQVFTLIRTPVLAGELWVREPEIPSQDELRALEREHAAARAANPNESAPIAVVDVRTNEAGEREVWVRWRRTPTFAGSGPRSRHYTLDSVAGILAFGNGTDGLIPPVGRDNLVLRDFRTGGGAEANHAAPALAIKELKTTLPFIDGVFNVQAAAAGASAWTLAQLEEFGPQVLKSRGRPVTTEDYEWLVRQRFSHVARVRCLPTTAPAPGGLAFKAGGVTVVVVPASAARRPQPSPGLIRKIREFLAQTALTNIAGDNHVKGPDYEAVDVHATLVPTRPELASVVVRKATAALERFLHPLTGGEDGRGYGFGRPVYLSEVHALLERIDEVDYVLKAEFPARPGAEEFRIGPDRLPSSGTHIITTV